VVKLAHKLAISIGVLGLVCAALPGSLRADETYTYTGMDYNELGGTYTTGGPYALSITFDTSLTLAQLENLPGTDITADITSFTFSDGSGNNIVDPGNSTSFDFTITTNAFGDIEGYSIAALVTPLGETGQYYEDFASFAIATGQEDFSENYAEIADVEQGSTNYGKNESYANTDYENTGFWSAPAAVTTPEPSTLPLLGIGLIGVLLLAARRKRLPVAAAVR
jgi:PEP-CTERM motif